MKMSYKDDLYINEVLKLLFLIKYVITSKLQLVEKRSIAEARIYNDY
jgi:hypothetical protein